MEIIYIDLVAIRLNRCTLLNLCSFTLFAMRQSACESILNAGEIQVLFMITAVNILTVTVIPT